MVKTFKRVLVLVATLAESNRVAVTFVVLCFLNCAGMSRVAMVINTVNIDKNK